MFPEYFLFDKIVCQQANIENGIPLPENFADALICQEGLEHFTNQLDALKEFNRVLKLHGKLILTTPSYSNLSAKISYLLFESETTKQMPPNEFDDVWMSEKEENQKIYFGHLFLIGIQKLRTLSKLAGFNLIEARYMRLSKGSVVYFILFYPIIVLSSYIRYLIKKYKLRKHPYKYDIISLYHQQLLLNINPKHLLNKHLFLIFEKECHFDEVSLSIRLNTKEFGKIM